MATNLATLVDSCVLLDVATGDARWADWSAERVAEALDAGRVVINPLIYAEVSVGYQSAEELDVFLPARDYEREALPYRAGFAAGKAFLRYRHSGWHEALPAAGLLHWRPCRGGWLPAADQERQPVPQLFSEAGADRPDAVMTLA